jgi:hypothetical protein
VALLLAALLLVVVVVTLPFALRSMWVELIEGREAMQYDGLTGQVVNFADANTALADKAYATIAVVDVDEAGQVATLAISGNRGGCVTDCPPLTLTLLSLSDAARRRGLPPSATIEYAPEDRLFSDTVQLPLRGNPNVYPFDSYELWLGLVLTATLPDGSVHVAHPADIQGTVFTIQDNVAGLNMLPPVPIDPASVQTATDPYQFLTVQRLEFERPAYQGLLAVLLVVLISVSAALALFMRAINDLVLGIGGLILGIWGVRSVVVPKPPADVNAVDVALAFVILLLLVALAVRAARHYQRESQLPPVRRRRAHAEAAER